MKKVLAAIQAALAALTESKSTGPRAESIQAHLKSCESNALAEVKESAKEKEPAPEKKEGAFTLLQVMVMVAIVAIGALVLATAARAASFYQSFGATNSVASAATLTGFPTNTFGSNFLTGVAVSVANQEHASFVFKSEPVGADATNSMTIKMVRAYTSSQPSLTLGSKGWAAFPDWETLPSLTLVFNQNGTNTTTWATNLDFYIAGASHVGIYSIQNGQSAVITNMDMGMLKKSVPITYP